MSVLVLPPNGMPTKMHQSSICDPTPLVCLVCGAALATWYLCARRWKPHAVLGA